jgi:hypothetical protein
MVIDTDPLSILGQTLLEGEAASKPGVNSAKNFPSLILTREKPKGLYGLGSEEEAVDFILPGVPNVAKVDLVQFTSSDLRETYNIGA